MKIKIHWHGFKKRGFAVIANDAKMFVMNFFGIALLIKKSGKGL